MSLQADWPAKDVWHSNCMAIQPAVFWIRCVDCNVSCLPKVIFTSLSICWKLPYHSGDSGCWSYKGLKAFKKKFLPSHLIRKRWTVHRKTVVVVEEMILAPEAFRNRSINLRHPDDLNNWNVMSLRFAVRAHFLFLQKILSAHEGLMAKKRCQTNDKTTFHRTTSGMMVETGDDLLPEFMKIGNTIKVQRSNGIQPLQTFHPNNAILWTRSCSTLLQM